MGMCAKPYVHTQLQHSSWITNTAESMKKKGEALTTKKTYNINNEHEKQLLVHIHLRHWCKSQSPKPMGMRYGNT